MRSLPPMIAAIMLSGAVGLSAAAGGQTTPVTASPSLLLTGVTVVDTRDGRRSPGMAIEIADGRIVRIGRAGELRPAKGVRRVDARGKFVVPGFVDMHAHPLDSPDPVGSLALMLANGITGFRQMSGSPTLLRARRDGALPTDAAESPALLAMPGTILTPENAATSVAAKAEVDRQKADGADFIKVVQISPPVFSAVAEEAKRQGLPFLGHLPPAVPVLDAARAGMHSIEHLGPTGAILISCSGEEPALRAAMAQQQAEPALRAAMAQQQAPRLPSPPPPVPASAVPGAPSRPPIDPRTLVNPILQIPAAAFTGLDRTLATYDEARCAAVARTLADGMVWQVPTLLRLKTMEFGDAAEFREDPNLRYVPPGSRALWNDVGNAFSKAETAATRATLARLYAMQLRLVGVFARAHVPMMAGTDFGGGWVIAGFGLHLEFDLLAQAGLSPLAVLQMTTLNPARFLGRETTMGRIAAGQDADLVLLDADPVASVTALHGIDAVVRGGRYYSRADLDRLKAAVAGRHDVASAAK